MVTTYSASAAQVVDYYDKLVVVSECLYLQDSKLVLDDMSGPS